MIDLENPILDDEITRTWQASDEGMARGAYVPDLGKTIACLKKNRYEAQYFASGSDAVDYLNSAIDGKSVGIGDSMTLAKLNIYDKLSSHNDVRDMQHSPINHGTSFAEFAKDTLLTDIFMCSASAITESGIIVNMDGTGNRVAASLFGHEKVYYVVGINKICPDLDHAIWRVRNIAAPRNCRRKQKKTPCALKADHCHNCMSPERICNGLLIEFKKMTNIDMEVIIIGEPLGL